MTFFKVRGTTIVLLLCFVFVLMSPTILMAAEVAEKVGLGERIITYGTNWIKSLIHGYKDGFLSVIILYFLLPFFIKFSKNLKGIWDGKEGELSKKFPMYESFFKMLTPIVYAKVDALVDTANMYKKHSVNGKLSEASKKELQGYVWEHLISTLPEELLPLLDFLGERVKQHVLTIIKGRVDAIEISQKKLLSPTS